MESPLVLLKFCREHQYLNDIHDGKLYANSFLFFRSLEKQHGERGQGDRHEGCAVIPNITELIVRDPESGLEMERVDGSKIKYREVSFSNPADNNRGIISFFGVPLSKFTDPKKDGNDFYRTIDISDEDLHYLTDKFGPYVVIITPWMYLKRQWKNSMKKRKLVM